MQTSKNRVYKLLTILVSLAFLVIPLGAVNAAENHSASHSPTYGWNGTAYTGMKAPFEKGTTVKITGDPSSHGGNGRHAVDIGMDFQPVVASVGGKILAYKPNVSGAGMELDIDTEDGYCTVYLHLDSVDKKFQVAGTSIKQGEKFAKSGNGYGKFKNHLHIEVNRMNNRKQCNADDSTPEVPMYFDEIPDRELKTGDQLTSQNEIIIGPGVLLLSQELSLSTTSPTPGQSVTASFKVKNVGGMSMTLQNLSAGARQGADWNGVNVDFPAATNITLQPGQEYSYQQSRSFDAGGNYFAEPVVQINGQWGGIPMSNGSFSRVNFSINVPGLPPVPAPPSGQTSPPVAPTVDYRFIGNPSSNLRDNNGSADLTVCADNIVGRTVYVNFRRPEGSGWKNWDYSQKATSRCVTFKDMDGKGTLNGGTLYESRAALDQKPKMEWSNKSCYAGNANQQGLCDTVRKNNQK